MGDPSRPRMPFSSQPFGNDVQNTAPDQRLFTSEGNQNLFAMGLKTVLSSPATQNPESSNLKPSFFGSSVFPQSGLIFGGNTNLSTTQALNTSSAEETSNLPQPRNIGKLPSIFGGGSTKLPPVTNSIFGGTFTSSQTSNTKLSGITSPIIEPSSSPKTNIFGGISSKKEDSTSKLGFPLPLKAQNTIPDRARDTLLDLLPGDSMQSSFRNQSSRPTEKSSLFPSSKAIFGKVTAGGIVTSSLSNQERADNHKSSHEKESERGNADATLGWEPDSQGEENQEDAEGAACKEIVKSAKVIRKRGVFGRAIEDMAKPSSRNQPTEEIRSIMFHPLDGELPDAAVLKNHFSQFGHPRVTLTKEKQRGIATFKTHEEAERAMRGGHVIDGVNYKFFWRNMAKSRRRSGEEVERKSPEERKKKVKQTVLDPFVQEELDAMSGIEYYIPEESSSKRKVSLDSEARKKSRSQVKLVKSDVEGLEETEEKSEFGKRNERSKDVRSRINDVTKEARLEEKPPLRSRITIPERKSIKKSAKIEDKDVAVENKPEKGDPSSSESVTFSTAALSELRETLKQQALSPEDKLRVLEARDKLMRLRQKKQYDISKVVKTVGTCPDMCPEKERLLRETRRQISQYETNSLKPNEMDPSLMVKQYSRSSADQEEPLPHELRPPGVLTMTMNYLMHSIMNLGDQPGENLGEWYHFLWDRLRGIRKEITQQELCDTDAVRLVEQCARFHIHCGARLVAEDMSVFDDRINTENLTKCLQTLKHMYHDLWTNNSITCPNEPEFITYFLLLNLNNGTIMWEMEQLREDVLKSPEIGFVAAMYNSLSSNNFVRFFRLVRKASYLNSCLCIRYFYQVRSKALGTYVKALAKIRPVQYPLGALVEELGFENLEGAAAFCTHHGLMLENTTSDAASVILSTETFESPGFVITSERAFKLAESKKMGRVGEVVNGGPLPPRSFDGHIVHESFDENGFLRKTALLAKDQDTSGLELRERDEDNTLDDLGKAETQLIRKETIAFPSSATSITENFKKGVLQTSSGSFGFNYQNPPFTPVLPSSQPSTSAPFSSSSSQIFKTFTQSITPQRSNLTLEPLKTDSIQKSSIFKPDFKAAAVAQAQAKMEAERESRELEEAISKSSELEMQEILKSCVQEATTEIAQLEWNAAEELRHTEERHRMEEQLRAQEELRKRILEAHVDRISSESMSELIYEVTSEIINNVAQEIITTEVELLKCINQLSEESLVFLLKHVVQELCHDVALEELKQSQESARQQAIQECVRQMFYFWLKRARNSLHRKRVMEDFPASIIPLSIKEHAERWGLPEDVQANAAEACSKGNKKSFDLQEFKGISNYPQIVFAELIGAQAVHRYDVVRTKLGLRPTDKLLYKLFISVSKDWKDPATQLIDWWIQRTFKQDCSKPSDTVENDVYRLVSGVKVTSEVAVYGSLQMVRGLHSLDQQKGLISGTSAVLFTVSPVSSLQEAKSRLKSLLDSIEKLPALPLVVAVICPSEPPLDGLKQMVFELELDVWLRQGTISDYQILHVKDIFDIKYLSERFGMAFNYMVMTWNPSPEFTLVCLKNVLKSTFQMFYISIQFNYNRSEIYPQDVDDPRIIIGLCNEWLDHMCEEFVESYQEARCLCGEEFWPLVHDGAFLPFVNNTNYLQLLRKVMQDVHLPPMVWPPSSEADFQSILGEYCSWLRPEEQKHTQLRLSCLSSLTWPEKINAIPWVNLIEDWMEARINYLKTSDVCGKELLCLMRAQNVEYLYSSPWWAHSKYIISYQENLGSEGDCAMDVDRSVPNLSISDKQVYESSLDQEQIQVDPENGVVQQLQKVEDCINKLKSANQSLLTRLQKALTNESGNCPQDQIISEMDLQKGSDNKKTSNFTDLKSLVDTTDLQVQHQYVCTNQNEHNSKTVHSPKVIIDDHTSFTSSVNQSTKNKTHISDIASEPCKEMGVENVEKKEIGNSVASEDVDNTYSQSSKKMSAIMAAANDIFSRLNQKYKILDTPYHFERISDLKIGVEKLENSEVGDLHPSPFVHQSQHRMEERLQRQSETYSSKKSQISNTDSDSEELSEEEIRSPVLKSSSSSSIEIHSNDDEDDSDERYYSNRRVQNHRRSREVSQSRKRRQPYHSDSEDENHRKRPQSDQSDSEKGCHSPKRRQQYVSDSDDCSGRRQSYRSDSDDRSQSSRDSDSRSEDDGSLSRKSSHHNWERNVARSYKDTESTNSPRMRSHSLPYDDTIDAGSNDESGEQAENSESDGFEEEEVQTVSSDDSKDNSINHLDYSSISEPPSDHPGEYIDRGKIQTDSNYIVCSEECDPEDGLLDTERDEQNLINLDTVNNDYKYFEQSAGVYGGEAFYSAAVDENVLQAEEVQTETVLLNSDQVHAKEGAHALLSHFENSSEDGHQNEVEVHTHEIKDSEESILVCSGETVHTNSDEEDYNQLSPEKFSQSSVNRNQTFGDQSEQPDSEEEYEEEEETSHFEEEEYEDEAEGEENMEEEDSVNGSEEDEDSDVCEVIDD